MDWGFILLRIYEFKNHIHNNPAWILRNDKCKREKQLVYGDGDDVESCGRDSLRMLVWFSRLFSMFFKPFNSGMFWVFIVCCTVTTA